jgi:hypothetical protein
MLQIQHKLHCDFSSKTTMHCLWSFFEILSVYQRADSTLKRNGVMTGVYLHHKDLVWCFESEAFSGSVIESVHGEVDVLAGDVIEGHFLWEELPDESVHVLVGTTFPRSVWVCKETISRKALCHAFMQRLVVTTLWRRGGRSQPQTSESAFV